MDAKIYPQKFNVVAFSKLNLNSDLYLSIKKLSGEFKYIFLVITYMFLRKILKINLLNQIVYNGRENLSSKNLMFLNCQC